MLLKVRVRSFGAPALEVDACAIAAFEARCSAAVGDFAAYVMDGDSLLDPDALQQVLLPHFQADVFLSHGAIARKQVLQLAVMLEQVGLRVYVGSCLWHGIYSLQQRMDEVFSARRDAPGTHHFHYHKVARTSASVHMLLNAVLQRMIDQCELFLHVEGEDMRIEACVDDARHAGSPWVFAELAFARHLARRGRPPLALAALQMEQHAAGAPLSTPQPSHVVEWNVLLRAIADTSGLPTSAYRRDPPMFLDHLYGKLPLSMQERALLGWA